MDEEQGLASPIAGGLRGIRRSVSSSVFTGRSAAPQNEGDSISTNLISQNSLTLNSVSLQLSGIKEQVRSVNSSLESIKNNLELSESLEKKKQAEKERREALLAEQGLREGAEGSLEKKIQFALLTPVRRVANFTKGILSRITDSLLFLAGGWLVDQTLSFLRLKSEGNVEGLKRLRNKIISDFNENFEANIISTGKSSIVIKIDAYKESKEIEKTLACTARFTFVSVQKDQFGTYKKINHNQTI